MSNVEVKDLPDAKFYPTFAMFPHIADNTFAAEQRAVVATNLAGKNQFDNLCLQWLSDASIARNAGAVIPPKPVSALSRVIVRQEVDGGTWIAQTDGPAFGVCPDLPAPIATTPGHMTGAVPAGTPDQPTQDQKLDSIAVGLIDANAKLDLLIAAFKKTGAM